MLPDFTSLEKLVNLLRTCKRVVVVTGAGIRQARAVMGVPIGLLCIATI